MGQYAIKIVAQHGFLGRGELNYRLICRALKDIHLDILGRLKMPSSHKWIHLIPVDNGLQYIGMKQ